MSTNEHILTVIGSSGSGKSTFLRCLNILEMPTSGEIIFKGQKMPLSKPVSSGKSQRKVTSERTLQSIRQQMGMVFQSFNLWHHLSILENVTCAQILAHKKSKAEAIETAERLLDRVGIADKRNQYPPNSFSSMNQHQR